MHIFPGRGFILWPAFSVFSTLRMNISFVVDQLTTFHFRVIHSRERPELRSPRCFIEDVVIIVVGKGREN